ncbi:UNVERIFIED_CONTAM: hypothetical protein HHA_235180 [Hammondia hammondi]|eukprot:XP_008881621.1 hypothetical protein HHA_235180 [Hammondia hammondi]
MGLGFIFHKLGIFRRLARTMVSSRASSGQGPLSRKATLNRERRPLRSLLVVLNSVLLIAPQICLLGQGEEPDIVTVGGAPDVSTGEAHFRQHSDLLSSGPPSLFLFDNGQTAPCDDTNRDDDSCHSNVESVASDSSDPLAAQPYTTASNTTSPATVVPPHRPVADIADLASASRILHSKCESASISNPNGHEWLHFQSQLGPHTVGSTVTIAANLLPCINAAVDLQEREVLVSLTLLGRHSQRRLLPPQAATTSVSVVGSTQPTGGTAVFTGYNESFRLRARAGQPLVIEWLVSVPGSYLIEATTDGFPPAVLGPLLAVETGSPMMNIIQQPQNGGSGAEILPIPVLEVVDSHGKRITSSTSIIVVYVHSPRSEDNQAGKHLPVLRGRTVARVSRGIASFPGLSIQEANKNYRLSFVDISGTIPVEVFSNVFGIAPGLPASLAIVEQPPPTVTPGQKNPFRAAVEVQDKHGNRASGEWNIVLRIKAEDRHEADRNPRPSMYMEAKSNISKAAVFDNISITDSLEGVYTLIAECTDCPNGPLFATSTPVRVVPKSEVWVLTDCGVIAPPSSADGLEGVVEHSCVLSVSLVEGGESASLIAPVIIEIDVLDKVQKPAVLPRIRVVPDEHVFIPGEHLTKTFRIEAVEQKITTAEGTAAPATAGSFPDRYTVLLRTRSNDHRWTEPAVRWPNGNVAHIMAAPGGESTLILPSKLESMESTASERGQPIRSRNDFKLASPGNEPEATKDVSGQPPEAASIKQTSQEPMPLGRLPSLFLSTTEDNAAQIKWNSTDILVREGSSIDLSFQLGSRPLDSVYVSISCPSPFIKHVKDRAEVQPEDWLFGDSLILNSLPRPGYQEAQYSVSCHVSSRSKDPRWVFDSTSFSQDDEDAGIFGTTVHLSIYRHQCHDGSFRGICPCPAGYVCDGATVLYKCPAGTERWVCRMNEADCMQFNTSSAVILRP